MRILDKNCQLMELKEYFCIIKKGYCCVKGKRLFEFKKCPICNFDDDGKLCVPHLCDEFLNLY